MSDLHRRALGSGKTISRKARSRLSSQPSSRASSRPASRQVSDNEDDNASDGTAWSTNSIDDLLALEEDGPPNAWTMELNDRIEQIIDRKRSSVQGREEAMRSYVYLISAHYAEKEVRSKLPELYTTLLRSVKSGTSEKEVAIALQALAVSVITCPSDEVHEQLSHPLKRLITDSDSNPLKAAACNTLAASATFGGASDAEIESIMEFLLSIVASDGEVVSAFDAGDVIAAAEQSWGFLATQIDDVEDVTEEAMDAFVEQLTSSDPQVQIAAGENIALLYEKSYTEIEDDESVPSDNDLSDADDPHEGPRMIRRYEVWRRQKQLLEQLSDLATISGHGISKQDKKLLHVSFRDILHGVEHPTRGPRYETALDPDGRRYGSRMSIRIHKTAEMRIDKWWKLQRLKALRKILQGGFLIHYEQNPVVFECLPIMLTR